MHLRQAATGIFVKSQRVALNTQRVAVNTQKVATKFPRQSQVSAHRRSLFLVAAGILKFSKFSCARLRLGPDATQAQHERRHLRLCCASVASSRRQSQTVAGERKQAQLLETGKIPGNSLRMGCYHLRSCCDHVAFL